MTFKLFFRLTFLTFLLTTSTFFSSCNSKNENENWTGINSFIHDTFRIDPSLKEQANLIMEGQEEVQTFDDILNKDTNKRKKSSTVKIIVLRDSLNDIEITDKLRCLANLKNDTLNINISINSGSSGKGVTIKYAGAKFSTNIYEFTDIVEPSEREPIFTIEKQKLALNKSNFVIGDSLYGHIYLRMVDNRKVKYYADGLFRAKITSRN